MATVTPSTTPRLAKPPDYPRKTPPATLTPSPWSPSTARDTARAEEILGLDIPDLDLPSKRGRVISKGGTTRTHANDPRSPPRAPSLRPSPNRLNVRSGSTAGPGPGHLSYKP
jgi:hypothetical protein